jgi:hypothetical protein
VYLVAFSIVSYADLYTTGLALKQPGTVEGNVYANGEGGYSSVAAWAITVAGAAFIVGCLAWSVNGAPMVPSVVTRDESVRAR